MTGAAAPRYVDVWCWRLDDAPVRDEIVSTVERQRAARFRHGVDARRYLAAHSGLRRILAGYLRTTDAALEFRTDSEGKPRLRGHAGLEFNLSHSGDIGALAVAFDHPVGVDIERICVPLPDFQGILSPEEQEWLADLSEPQRQRGFYRAWTCKEAVAKAMGTGLTMAPDEIVVDLAASPVHKLLRAPPVFEPVSDWQVVSFAPAVDMAGAVAAPLGGWSVREMGPPPW